MGQMTFTNTLVAAAGDVNGTDYELAIRFLSLKFDLEVPFAHTGFTTNNLTSAICK